jgi:hypothetical protein
MFVRVGLTNRQLDINPVYHISDEIDESFNCVYLNKYEDLYKWRVLYPPVGA